MRKIFLLVSIFVILLSIFNTAFADTTVHLKITTPTNTVYDQDITVTPCDSDRDDTTPEISTAYCAILQSGIQNDWNWAWAPGAFLNSLGDIAGFTTKDKDDNDVYHYWSWSLNGVEGTTGLNQYELQTNDLISLNFIDPAPVEPEPEPIIVHHSSSGSRRIYIPPTFDIAKAITYLKSTQGTDGSFGNSFLYTDWTAIALGSLDKDTYDVTESRNMILDYFKSNNKLSPLLTDNERHAMALLALGQNPYSFNGINYIDAIVKSFDGTQFGDKNLINDDIFALIPLYGAGYGSGDDIISKNIVFIISKQKNNGSWEDSVDLTSASIQALKSFETVTGVNDSITKATNYLTSEQGSDGGWNSVSSTSWAMQAMSSLSASWTKGNHTPNDYLATQQREDGAVSPSSETIANRIWATSYAIPAVLSRPWSVIMQNVPKPTTPVIETPAPIVKEKIIQKQVVKKIVAYQKVKVDTKKPEIIPETQTATVINTETEKTSSNTLPLTLGILSLIILVCVVIWKRETNG